MEAWVAEEKEIQTEQHQPKVCDRGTKTIPVPLTVEVQASLQSYQKKDNGLECGGDKKDEKQDVLPSPDQSHPQGGKNKKDDEGMEPSRGDQPLWDAKSQGRGARPREAGPRGGSSAPGKPLRPSGPSSEDRPI